VLSKRSLRRLTKTGMLYEQRIAALRRIQAKTQVLPRVENRLTQTEIMESERRWDRMRYRI